MRELAADPRAESLPAPTAVLLASFFEAAGEIDPAIAILRKAVVKHPEDLWVNYRLAANLQYATPPRLEEAARYYTAARSIRPTTAHMLAHVLSDLERTDQAKAIFLDLAARQPEDWNHLACLAHDLDGLGPGKSREAESIADRLIPMLRAAAQTSPNAAGVLLPGEDADAQGRCRRGVGLPPRGRQAGPQDQVPGRTT